MKQGKGRAPRFVLGHELGWQEREGMAREHNESIAQKGQPQDGLANHKERYRGLLGSHHSSRRDWYCWLIGFDEKGYTKADVSNLCMEVRGGVGT